MTAKQSQHLLAYLGYDCGEIDGIFGPRSREAAKRFQADTGLEADGVVGQQTEEALRKAVCEGVSRKETGWEQFRWFVPGEFACKCGLYHAPYCDGYPAKMDMRVVAICEQVREHFGVPVDIVSGLRCRQHNTDSGGVSNSQHLDGTASDICVRGVAASSVEAFLDTLGGVRYHYNIPGSQNVHFDVPREADT